MADDSPHAESSSVILEELKHYDIINCEEDFIYAAGIIDGEGCVAILRSRSKERRSFSYEVRLIVKMVDAGAILFLKKKFGGSVSNITNKPPKRDCWQWYLDGQRTIRILTRILPYLRVRHKQAALAIEFFDTAPPKTWATVPQEENERRERFYQQMRRLNKRGR